MKLTPHPKEKGLYWFYEKPGKKKWEIRHKYYDALGKRKEVKRRFDTEKAAFKALLEIKAQTLQGQTKQIEYDRLTVSQWLDIWYETNQNKWKINTRKQREMAIRLQMKPLLGNYKLQKLDKTTYIREYLNVLKKKYKPNTVQLFHRLFKIAVNAAVDDEILSRNRFTKISIYNEDDLQREENLNYFTPVQLVKFLSTAKETENITNYTFIQAVAYTGMRKGEALGLQWKDINFKDKTITIERTRSNKGVGTPKTKNSYRTILIDEHLIQQFETYRKWCREKMLSFGHKIKKDSFVFISHQTGEPVTDNGVMYAFRRVLKKANLDGVTIHGLRHTHCTILLNSGQNVEVVAERLGNTPQVIFDTYAHILRESESKSVTLFNQALKASGANFGADFL